ncbi:MAG: BolA family transcriptional regulator [Alphaproteobacteria bacterium]|nr:BolA family transcriptional regulator [Alphaproteobacteria bacterium]MBV9552602.1 BolA family transcriptional regulator [Alphaproteobacteria bacterium]
MSVADTIRRKLTARLAPVQLDIVDDSARHAGHLGHPGGAGQGGETHFTVTIVSAVFAGMSRVARQRLVYETLTDELKNGVHALALKTLTPAERGG